MPPRKRQHDADGDGETQYVKKSKSESKGAKPKKELGEGKDADGNKYWEIGTQRRAGISTFSGKTLVNIREYYTTPDGETRPGKKGISLTLDQYQALLNAIPQLNNELRSKGHDVQGPEAVDGDVPAAPSSPKVKKSSSNKSSVKSKKSNIEETSDEEGDDEDEDD